jgi:hypothetical protein
VANDYCINPVDVTYEVTYYYEEAYKMIDLVNEERRKAGVQEIKTNDTLMEIAMERAAESALYWRHKRPDGSSIWAKSMFIKGENLNARNDKAKDANDSLVNSPGHYATMVNEEWSYAGFGCANGYWVQIFTKDIGYYEVDGYPDESKKIVLSQLPLTSKQNVTTTYTAAVNPSFIKLSSACLDDGSDDFVMSDGSTESCLVGDVFNVAVKTQDTCLGIGGVEILQGQYDLVSSNSDVCTIENNTYIKCVGVGTTQIDISLKGASSVSMTINLSVKPIKKGTVIEKNGLKYKVLTSTSKSGTLSVQGGDEKKKIVIPDSIKVNGMTYKITEIKKKAFYNNVVTKQVIIGNNVTKIGDEAFYGNVSVQRVVIGDKVSKIGNGAFENNQSLKQVTIGKNVAEIGKSVFSCCMKLKKITIKSAKLKSVGKDSLLGIHKKAVISVPKSSGARYKKLFKNKGQAKTVKIKNSAGKY